jgi:hypothetical protein
MNPIQRLVAALADRVHPDTDLTLAQAGLTVTYRPDGTRIVRHPDMPAIAARYRARILARPDRLDALFIDATVRAQALREATAGRVRTGVGR